jgi:hypothetical protein
MKSVYRKLLFMAGLIICMQVSGYSQQDNGKIRIIMIGAHPDDCDEDGGGTAALYAQMGYAVKFVSVTNGDAGHQTLKGIELAKRVVDYLEHNHDIAKALTNCGFAPQLIENFRTAFFRSGKNSVDAFLEHRTEFSAVGKAATAAVLLHCESEEG